MKNTKKIQHLVYFGFVLLLCLVLYLLSMVTSCETRSYWLGRFTEEQQKYYKEYRLSEKGTQLWAQLHILNSLATNFCSKTEKHKKN